jgi:protein-glutamine gamma-glutamyltransferase
VSTALQNAARVPEAIERFFQFALFLMVLSGFAMLASTGKLDPVSLLIMLGALAARGWLLYHRREVQIAESTTNYFTVFYVAFYAVDFLFISGSFVTATVHLLLFVMGVKLFSVQRERDYLYLAALSFGMVLSAAVLTVDSVFLFSFALFLVLATATFIAMEVRRSALEGAVLPRGQLLTLSRIAKSIGSTAFLLVIAILIGASALFFALPRQSSGFFSRFAPRSALVTGFSNDVQLGQIGEIQQSNEVVMHVQIEGDTRGAYELKWRGVALSTFDGTQWKSLGIHSALNSDSGRYDLARWRVAMDQASGQPVVQPLAPWRPLRYRVLMEPLGTEVFFLAPVAYSLQTNFRVLSMDAAGAVTSDGSHPITAYTAVSNIGAPPLEALRKASNQAPATVLLENLQLPRVDPRVSALAQQITAGANNNFDRAAAIESYLQRNFGYTLQLPKTRPRDPIANFLFERKAGHCEYFASSMAVMLRTLGIPARVVNGFRGGEFNDVTGMYIVRSREAHSWVEAYLGEYGWVTFDPTPAGPAGGGASTARWHRIALYLDALSEFWREWVINYDFQHQMDLSFTTMMKSHQARRFTLDWIKKKYEHFLDSLRAFGNRPPPSRASGIYALIGLVVLLSLLNLRRIWRWRRERRLLRAPASAPSLAASLFYEQMVRRLATRGYAKPPGQTPQEFVRRVEDPELRPQVQRFTDTYERARFGESGADAEELPGLLEEIEK